MGCCLVCGLHQKWRGLERQLCLDLALAVSLSAGECACMHKHTHTHTLAYTQTRSPDNKPVFVLYWPLPPLLLRVLDYSWICVVTQLVMKEQGLRRERDNF